MTATSLYDASGGEPAFLALARDFHSRCLADPELNHPFSHADANPHHVPRLAAYWADVMGGPSSGLEQADMLRMHAGQGDMTDLGRRFAQCFDEAVVQTLPEDPALRETLHDYMLWAVSDVLAHEEPGDVPERAPVPRWTWDGLTGPS